MLLSLFSKQKLRGLIGTEPAADLEHLRSLIEAGTVTPVLDRTFPLAQAAAAHAYIESRQALGRVVMTP
jgi:NADPH:quinone reductase-like Zn-dependent oxidoreductase